MQDRDYTISIKEASRFTFPIIDYHYDLNSQTVKDKLIVFELQNWFFYDKEAITVKNLEHLIDLRKSTFPTIQKMADSPRTVTMYHNVRPLILMLGPLRRKRLRQLARSIRAILRFLSEPFRYILVKSRHHGRDACHTRRRPGYLD